MKLLALVFLLSALSSLALTEVVGSFQRCPDFFFRNPVKKEQRIFPTVFTEDHYKMICQRWKNKFRFATVYDTQRRIPVYSAYMISNTVKTERNAEWKIEPKLDGITKDVKGKLIVDTKEMMDSPNMTMAIAMKITHQAVGSDYACNWYDRGHVFPCFFAADQDQADSTFTITNIAPQTSDSNGRWAMEVETPMKALIKNKCKLDQNHQAYIVTGVVPGDQWIAITRGNQSIDEGINVPSYFWSAFCCTDKDDIKSLVGKAYLAKQKNFDLQNTTIDKLNTQLTIFYGKKFSVFPHLSCGK